MRILLSWIGNTDLACTEKNAPDDLCPIAQGLASASKQPRAYVRELLSRKHGGRDGKKQEVKP